MRDGACDVRENDMPVGYSTFAIPSKIKKGIAIAVIVLLLDQLAKYLIVNWIELQRYGSIQLMPFLNLTFARNSGMAMSLFDLVGDLGRWLLVGVTSAIAIVICWLIARAHRHLDVIAWGLVLGGALGNIADRIRLGYVVDFIQFHIGTWSFYIFNTADSAISVGIMIILFDQFWGPSRAEAG
jgi:signal peptidase II